MKIILKILTILGMFLFMVGCSGRYVDKSLKVNTFTVDENKVKEERMILQDCSPLTHYYNGIDEMYDDSDYVVSGEVKNIQYFEYQTLILRKIDVLVNKSYKGTIHNNTLITVLDYGYIRLKSQYESAKKNYEEKNKDIAKEDDYLKQIISPYDIKDIQNDMLIKYVYPYKVSKVDDKLMLFLKDSSYKNKKVIIHGIELPYPEGVSYATVGLFIRKFTQTDDLYIPGGHIELADYRINKFYTLKEMKDKLEKLSAQ